MRSRGSAAAWRATNPRMPSSSDSSLPVETSSTRTPAGGSSRSSRASSISSATDARLSFAPGTTARAAMSAIASTVPSAINPPARRTRGSPSSAPAPASAGPATTSCISRGDVSWRAYQAGNVSATQRVGPGWKIKPPRAASWCAANTTVSSASGSPASATTLYVARAGSNRRKRRGPDDTSSAIAAAAASPPAAARGRAPRDSPAAAAIAESSANGSGNEPVARSCSTRARQPCSASRSRIHSAARRSPSDAGGRSIACRCSTTARSLLGSGGTRGEVSGSSRDAAPARPAARLRVERCGRAH